MTPAFLLALPLFALGASATAAAPVDTLKLTLARAMETARHSAYSAQSAGSRSTESEARTAEARSALLPHVGATASDVIRSFNAATFGIEFPGSTHVDPFQVQDARIGARIILWDASAWLRYRAARQNESRSTWEQRAGEEDAAMAGAESYLALLRARSLIKARRYEVALAAQLDTLTQAQKKAGAVTQLEVLRAHGQLSVARMALAAATGDEAAARYGLLQVLNQPLDAEVVTTDTLSAQALPAGAGLSGEAAGTRPEIAAAAAEVEAAEAELRASRAGFFPTLEASGDYGLSGRKLYTGGAQWTEDAALQLNWSLWDGGGRGARSRQREEKLRQAKLRLADLRARSDRDVRVERALLSAAREESDRAAERVALAEEEARLAAEKFRAGSSGNLDVISAQGSVSAAHAAYVDALYGYNRTRLAALRSLNLLHGTNL